MPPRRQSSPSRKRIGLGRVLRIAALAWVTAVSTPVIARDMPQATKQLGEMIVDYDRWLSEVDPVSAGERGDSKAASRWPDDSLAAVTDRNRRLVQFQERLKTIDAHDLLGEDALNASLLAWMIDIGLRGAAFDEQRIPFTSDEGFFLVPAYAAETTVLRNAAQANAWLARLAAIPAYYEIETENLQTGLQTGFTQPKITASAALRTVKAAAAVPAEHDPLLAPLAALPDTMPQAARAALRGQGLAIIVARVKPAEAKLAAFLERVYLPHARDSIGASSLPGGRAYYAYLVRRETTTDMTPDAVFALGEAEIARIRTAMDAQISASGFHGGFASFQSMLRHDTRFYATSPEALLERASRLAKIVDDQLPRLFGRLPRLSYGVRAVPHAIEDGYTSARYNPGSPEQGVAGGLMINTSYLDQRPLYELPALVADEGAPGHHIQIALAQELTGLPAFRRDMQITAFVEGWALYAEQLGVELGLYRTPYERFGLLSMEMWRACRLVMDVGIHWRGWTRDQALACLRDNTALAERNMQSEVDRYIAWPGQALGYKVGELRILALRHRAETELGTRFDERALHDELLDEGAMPLTLLESRVSAWISEARGVTRQRAWHDVTRQRASHDAP